MTIQGAIECLTDKTQCRYCKYDGEECRKDAIDTAVKSLKAWDKVLDKLSCVDRLYYNTGFTEILVIPKSNVIKIINECLKGVEE